MADAASTLTDEILLKYSPQNASAVRNYLLQYSRKKIAQGMRTPQIKRKMEKIMQEVTSQENKTSFGVEAQASSATTQHRDNDFYYNNANVANPYQYNYNETSALWQDLKEEIFEVLASVFGGETTQNFLIPFYEWESVKRAALSFLQVKERQYRRLPRQAIERVLDEILPSAESGRSFVRFLINELSRLRQPTYGGYGTYGTTSTQNQQQQTEQTSLRDRALRIVGYVLAEFAERQFLPIPSVKYLDDEAAKQQIETRAPIPGRANRSFEDVMEIVIDFSKSVYAEFVDRQQRRKTDSLFIENMLSVLPPSQYTYGSSSSSFRSQYNRYSSWGSTGNAGYGYNSRLGGLDQNNSEIGGLQVTLPMYRNPQKRLEFLKAKRMALLQRFETVKQVQSLFEELSPKQKALVSMAVAQEVKEQRLQVQSAKQESEFIEPLAAGSNEDTIVPTHLIKKYYDRYLKQESIKVVRHMSKEMNQQYFLKKKETADTKHPDFFYEFGKITKKDVESATLTGSTSQQIQEDLYSKHFLRILRQELPGKFSYEDFKKLIIGPFSNLEPVQNLIRSIAAKQGLALEATRENSQEPILSELYKLVFEPNVSVEKPGPTRVSVIASKLVEFVTQSPEERLLLVEEFCLEQLLKIHKGLLKEGTEGYEAILEMVSTMKQSLQYDPISGKLDTESTAAALSAILQRYGMKEQQMHAQSQAVLRQGAYEFIRIALEDQHQVRIPSKELSSVLDRSTAHHQKAYKDAIKQLLSKHASDAATTQDLDYMLNGYNEKEKASILLYLLEVERMRNQQYSYEYENYRLNGK